MKIEKIASSIEYALIGLSFLGTITAMATQQIAYVSAPLALSVSLSLLNRKRALSNANQQITRLEQLITSDARSTIDQIEIFQQSLATVSLTSTTADNQRITDICSRIDNLDYSIGDLKDNNFILTSRLEDYQQYNLLTQTALSSALNNNNLVREVVDHSPKYEYELVLGREQSRQALLEALGSVENRLILVCPWLCHHGFDLEIQNQFEKLLSKGVTIKIGYGKLSDIEKGKLTGLFYNTLKQATSLANKYPNFKLKLIGTHEKYLVCDRSFAMLGSHNFLTSGVGEEREIGIRTTDPALIERLIERYEQALDRELSYALN
ncbi:MAG: phospholipase D-like domain-containing protein [Chamaesiphon sp.]|nr:phospholipase D-like domain-containing protein [Chamaesiphon sp.]